MYNIVSARQYRNVGSSITVISFDVLIADYECKIMQSWEFWLAEIPRKSGQVSNHES